MVAGQPPLAEKANEFYPATLLSKFETSILQQGYECHRLHGPESLAEFALPSRDMGTFPLRLSPTGKLASSPQGGVHGGSQGEGTRIAAVGWYWSYRIRG